jgi:hypothetical protein
MCQLMLTLFLEDVTRRPYGGEVVTPQVVPEDEPMLSRRVRRTEACSPEGTYQEVCVVPIARVRAGGHARQKARRAIEWLFLPSRPSSLLS